MKKRKWMTAAGGVVLVGISLLAYIYLFHSYGGSFYTDASMKSDESSLELKSDANGNGISNKDEIAQEAEKLAGTLYDPLKGGVNNTGGKLGFIVCIDVPRIAYGKAGISLAGLLQEDYAKHPERYQTEGGANTPDTPYFYRRVRNVYDFAEGNGLIIKKAEKPQVGDIVFYGRYHATLVTAVHADGTYNEVEAHPKLIIVQEHKRKKWTPRDVARILK
ncbi:DUF1287 domain-containing protein [Falsibacillus pallidus]|uniref:Uncharacterized protein DUF1287 n=1 Tax=Falsibacillus pallidus TaxID=493781 RepID=A0A370H1R8_9BACI|nr:DUF1287 domain-containing protein [Falsibacillus pallidus]RDI47983.1 uncharacterized protein DUF1287 [Falsibacillus pallidus]